MTISSFATALFLALNFLDSHAFQVQPRLQQCSRKNTELAMGLDMVTYMRTEWISAALCTNQTPREADVCLQLGCEDGRAVTFVPRTIDQFITSTLEPDGVLPVSVERQLTQQEKTRNAAVVTFRDQRADDLKETPDESVDIVVSLGAAARMIETGLDWKKSVQEAARVLKPGGRLLFVEQTELNGESYLDYVDNLGLEVEGSEEVEEGEEVEDDDEVLEERFPIFEEVGYDDVDLVLVPHVAGVALKSMDAGMTAAERDAREAKIEQERQAEISLAAFERGIKKRKKKKKANASEEEA
mmetsp:Transcript_13896/g.33606  ORF Transcript_13896/g.33606 Transcript_13896/m.33606 type:complete len:299 (+) Transcript_13896:34-930(+)